MRPSRTLVLGLGTLATLSAVTLAQQAPVPPTRPQAVPSSGVETVVVPGQIEWIHRSAIAAKRPGVLQSVELNIGMEAKAGTEIASLHNEMALLTKDKAQLQYDNPSGVALATAKRDLALANMARAERLKGQNRNLISQEEYQTKAAELKAADAELLKANEDKKTAKAELDLATQEVEDHVIRAPFDGSIFEVLKHPGESIQAGDAVVHMVKTDEVRFFGYVPFVVAERLKVGMVVDVAPVVDGSDEAVEKQRFRGKLVFIGPELAPSKVKAEIQIKADIVNNVERKLRPGLKAEMTIYMTDDQNQVPPAPADMLRLPAKPDRVVGTRVDRNVN
jgi:RND family efflux transporter MFP subunit